MPFQKSFRAILILVLSALFAHPSFAQEATGRAGAGRLVEFKLWECCSNRLCTILVPLLQPFLLRGHFT